MLTTHRGGTEVLQLEDLGPATADANDEKEIHSPGTQPLALKKNGVQPIRVAECDVDMERRATEVPLTDSKLEQSGLSSRSGWEYNAATSITDWRGQ